MAEPQLSLLPLYQGWDTYQELLLKALEPLSLDQLSLRPAPQLRSIGENAAHIVGTRVGMIHRVLGEGDAALELMNLWDSPGAPKRSEARADRRFERHLADECERAHQLYAGFPG